MTCFVFGLEWIETRNIMKAKVVVQCSTVQYLKLILLTKMLVTTGNEAPGKLYPSFMWFCEEAKEWSSRPSFHHESFWSHNWLLEWGVFQRTDSLKANGKVSMLELLGVTYSFILLLAQIVNRITAVKIGHLNAAEGGNSKGAFWIKNTSSP